MTSILVFHNLDARFGPYRAGHRLVPVAILTPPADLDTDAALGWAYRELNIGEEGQAAKYRQRQNRSLSVGDVLALNGQAWAVAPFGYDEVEPTVGQIVYVSDYGTTPLVDTLDVAGAV